MLINKASGSITPTKKEKDPTGQQSRRMAAAVDIKKRISKAREPVLELLDSIPYQKIQVNKIVSIFTGNKVVYKYDLDAYRLLQISDEIDAIIKQLLELDQLGKPSRWFFDAYLSAAYQDGTAEAALRLQALTKAAGLDFASSQLGLEQILFSEPYRRRFELVSARAFENMIGFAGSAAADLGRILGDGVASGRSARSIARSIREKFEEIENYRALRIARTETNKAFTEARADQAIDARDRLGIELKLMHLSALVPATRKTHAQRHGHLYTPEAQSQWWAEGSNRINCLCSTVEILYLNGEPVQKDFIEMQLKRGKAFFGGG